jgi:hypothetical protein
LLDIFGEKLQGDKAPKLGIRGLVDDAHAPATELLDDPVVRDGLADHGWRRTQGAVLGMRGSRVNEGGTPIDAGKGKSRDFGLSHCLVLDIFC